MGMIRKMGANTGDERFIWDEDNADQVEEARAVFAAAKKEGLCAYRVEGSGRGDVIRDFDPSASDIILAPMVRGG